MTTIGDFHQTASTTPFDFNNPGGLSGPSSTFDTSNGTSVISVPVVFHYQIPNGYETNLTNAIDATLTLTADVAAAASQTPLIGFGTLKSLNQPLDHLRLTITALTPVSGKSNLLTVDVNLAGQSTANLTGIAGGHTAGLSSDTGGTGLFAFKSDFLSFPVNTQEQYALSLTALTSVLTRNGNLYLNNFFAHGSGSFAASASIPSPEPSTWLLLICGGVSLLAVRRRRSCTAVSDVPVH